MVKLQFFNGTTWEDRGNYVTDKLAWARLKRDGIYPDDHRTVDSKGKVVTDMSENAVKTVVEEKEDTGLVYDDSEEGIVPCDCLVAGDCEVCSEPVGTPKHQETEDETGPEEDEVNPLDYVSAAVPEGCTLKISPSSFGTFIERPWAWFREQIQGIGGFEYSTSSVIGTIVHYVAETVGSGKEISKKHIEDYIEKHEENESYCKETVRLQWPQMATVLVNDYVLPNNDNMLAVEMQVAAELVKGIFPAGTLDLLEGTKEDCMLVDYKTYHSKTKPKTITSLYRYQLCVYVWILRKLGYNVTRIRLVYINRNIDGGLSEKTGKPLKSYPPEVTVLTESVNEDDMVYIESMLNLCADTIEASNKHPELRSVIWHDQRASVDYVEPPKLG